MKKLLSVLALSGMTAFAIGCGGSSPSTPSSKTQIQKSVEEKGGVKVERTKVEHTDTKVEPSSKTEPKDEHKTEKTEIKTEIKEKK